MKELSIILKKDDIAFDAEDQHFRCFAHILNLGVQDISINVNPDKPLKSMIDKTNKEENLDDVSESENENFNDEQTISESLLDDKIDRNYNDEKLLLAIQNGRDKILKHYKMYNWGAAIKEESLKKFEEIYQRDYFVQLQPISEKPKQMPKSVEDSFNIESLFDEDENKEAEPCRKEISKYLGSLKEPTNTNDLDWWKTNCHIHPTLS
ncbi:hypothetical protein TSAR_009411, partial [Trichomalopsis sarcophagae]